MWFGLMSVPLYRRIEEGAQLMDFKCVAFVEELIYGEYRRHPLEGEPRR